MKVIQVKGARDARVAEMPAPVLKEDSAIIKIRAVGICGSDLLTYQGVNLNVKEYPIVIGHETAGEIHEVGENPYGFKKGDRVILDPYLFCGECYPCGQGRTNCCEDLHCLGVHCDGSMCEYFTHPLSLLRRVPDGIPWETVPLAEPLVIGLHSLHRIKLAAGEHCVIVGGGTIGLMAAMGALVYGGIPIVVDVVDERLEVAKSVGVQHVLNPTKCDAVAEVFRLTKGRGAECVVEASGAAAGVRSTLEYAAYTGRVALTGWPKGDVTLSTAIITKRELDVRGARNGAGEFEEALRLIAEKKVPVEKVVSSVVPFEQLPEMLEKITTSPGDYLKVIGVLEG